MAGLESSPAVSIDEDGEAAEAQFAGLHESCELTITHLQDEVASKLGRISGLEIDMDTLRGRNQTLMTSYQEFKRQVRNIAIEQHHEGRWCRAGLNEKLEELGLEPYIPRYMVHMTVEVVLEVSADDESDAADEARNDLSVTSSDENWFDVLETRVTNVEEQRDDE